MRFPLALIVVAIGLAPPSTGRRVEVLRSVDAIPAHIVSALYHPFRFEQIASGQYFIFDVRDQAVYGIDRDTTAAWKLVGVGFESGRVIDPVAFAAEPGGTFLVVDSPGNQTRLQIFATGGSRIGGFTLSGRPWGRVRLGSLTVSGLWPQYTGRAILMNQPETGSLITEYTLSGFPQRSIGRLRATGQEHDQRIHLALNQGFPLVNPRGGYYFVFNSGIPLLHKYDAAGRLVFERHIEGIELDELLKQAPTRWVRREKDSDEIPLVVPHVAAAAVDAAGSVWLALSVPYTYVYDADGEKQRVVQFRGASLISPTSLSFAPGGRLLVTPGCYEFDPK
jgi:hypothetical protein